MIFIYFYCVTIDACLSAPPTFFPVASYLRVLLMPHFFVLYSPFPLASFSLTPPLAMDTSASNTTSAWPRLHIFPCGTPPQSTMVLDLPRNSDSSLHRQTKRFSRTSHHGKITTEITCWVFQLGMNAETLTPARRAFDSHPVLALPARTSPN